LHHIYCDRPEAALDRRRSRRVAASIETVHARRAPMILVSRLRGQRWDEAGISCRLSASSQPNVGPARSGKCYPATD
jgi:hypothetical protein